MLRKWKQEERELERRESETQKREDWKVERLKARTERIGKLRTILAAAEGRGGLFRRSAPAGSVATAYPAARPHSSAHGFTDTSFQPVVAPGSEGPGKIDSTTAAAISDWARSVAGGQVQLEKGQDSLHQLVREIGILAAAKVRALDPGTFRV